MKSRAKVFRKKNTCWVAGRGHRCPGKEKKGRHEKSGLLMLGSPFLIHGSYCRVTFKSTFALVCVADAGHEDRSEQC